MKLAQEMGEEIVVALMGDNIEEVRLRYNQIERESMLEKINIASKIVRLQSNEIDEALIEIEPDVLLLGKEHEKTNNKNLKLAVEIQLRAGRSVIYDSGDTHYSSIELLENSQETIEDVKSQTFKAVCYRNKITFNSLKTAIRRFKYAKLLIIGDTIVDQYAGCEAIGLSAEAPVVVVKEIESKNFIGGAAIVAAHVKALGAECSYISIIGDDKEGDYAKTYVKNQGIESNFFVDSSRPTTLKKRYVVDNQKIFRVSRLEEKFISSEIEKKIIVELYANATRYNGIIVSDFNYGVITENILIALQDISVKYGIKLYGDVQSSSQVGTILKLEKFDLICPNEREGRIALQDKDSGIENLSQKILEITQAKNLIMKLGPDGFIAYKNTNRMETESEAFPALTANPVDVAGAGDSVLAIMATGLTENIDLFECCALACCMASASVETMGNTPIKSDILMERVAKMLSTE